MGKMICFDMDGTIADLYGVPGWLEKLRAENPSPYLDAKPMWDMDALNAVVNALIAQGWEVRIVSWLSKDATPEYKRAIRKAKIEWLARYNFPYQKAHLIQYGTTKANPVRAEVGNNPAILIDDTAKVRDGWTLGDTIDPMSIDDLPKELEKLLINEEEEVPINCICPSCGAETKIMVRPSGYKCWRSGELIQYAMPDLSSSERETLISGLCPVCQTKYFI